MNARAREMPLRVAVLCDFLEERWLSMNLVGDMLYQHLRRNVNDGIAATQIRPQSQICLARLPALDKRTAWNADRMINRFCVYPLYLRKIRDDFDVFHLIDHSYSHLVHNLPADRTIITCHDLDTFRCILEPDREPRPAWFRAMVRRILAGLRRAGHVIAVSSATRDALLHYGIAEPGRVTVVLNGVHPAYSPLVDRVADAETTRLLPRDANLGSLLLNVGTTIPRKRIDLLLRIFAAIRSVRPDVHLVRVGGPFTSEQCQMVQDLQLKDAITVLPFIEAPILASVYRRADALLHTAESEGFGLPLIEAMACGCPVVASDIPALREVGGDGAMFCSVGDVATWQNTVTQLLAEREHGTLSAGYRERILSQASLFNWTQNARRTATLYRSLFTRYEESENKCQSML